MRRRLSIAWTRFDGSTRWRIWPGARLRIFSAAAYREAAMSATTSAAPAGDVVPWHAMSAAEAEQRLKSNPANGLDAVEAVARLQTYGPNRLPEGKKRGPFLRFLSQCNNILIYVLLVAGFV